jgi:hypothetical protein
MSAYPPVMPPMTSPVASIESTERISSFELA